MSTLSADRSTSSSFLKRRRVPVTLIVIFLICQSITMTLPIEGRVVDESGQPIRDAQIAALWLMKTFTPIDTGPGGAVRVSHVTSDSAGHFHVPAAFILHTPTLPFSWFTRSNDMPRLIVVAPGYRATLASNDEFGLEGPASSGGFWFLRASSLRGSNVRLQSLGSLVHDSGDAAEANSNFAVADTQIGEAQSSCRRRWTCRNDSLEPVLAAMRGDAQDLQRLLQRQDVH